MASIGLRELSHHTSQIVNRVRQGEVIEVTDHGRPVLRLVPIREPENLRERLVSEGRLRPATRRGIPQEISGLGEEVNLADLMSSARDE